jgi:hypothetical protein
MIDKYDIPVFQVHAAFYAISYGYVGFLEPGKAFNLNWTSESNRQYALVIIFISLIMLYSGYYYGGSSIRRSGRYDIWPLRIAPNAYSYFIFLVIPVEIIVDLIVRNYQISEVVHIYKSIYNFSIIFAIHAAFSGKLSNLADKFVVMILVPYQMIIGSDLVSSLTWGFIHWGIVIVLTYIGATKRIPYLWGSVIVAFFLAIQPIKKEYRARTWFYEESNLGYGDKILLFGEMIGNAYFGSLSTMNLSDEENNISTVDRMNNLNTMAAIITDTPSRQPHMHGETYMPLLTKFIPRFLWPEKPLENTGNSWGVRYGYLSKGTGTSFNLPWVPEMYMNFGLIGVLVLSALVGVGFAWFSRLFWIKASDPSSYAFGMVIGMPLFYVEGNLSLVAGKLIISALSLVIFGWVISGIFPAYLKWR